MKAQTVCGAAIAAVVLWFLWEPLLATALSLFGYGLAVLIWDSASTFALFVLVVVGWAIWGGAKWLLERWTRR